MNRYLVGGAVRDKLLGLPIKDRDWVVVGSSPDEMVAKGFQQVGKDFPVFLHPDTKEEHALARTERKSGSGYSGFVCDFGPEIRLEDDLARRDLTINAIAENDKGELIDPYHGAKDLKQGILRHVSPAFVEDPLRVLRVARFYSRLQPLGFRVAETTKNLLRNMAASGELTALTAERVWQEVDRALSEVAPEKFFELLHEVQALPIVLPELVSIFQGEAAEDEAGQALRSLQQAVHLTKSAELRFATICHDLGHSDFEEGTSGGGSQAKESDNVKLARELANRLRIPKRYLELGILACQFQKRISGIFASDSIDKLAILEIMEQADAIRRPERFQDLLLVCEAIAKGQNERLENYPQSSFLREILTRLQSLDIKSLLSTCIDTKDIIQTIKAARLHLIETVIEEHITNSL